MQTVACRYNVYKNCRIFSTVYSSVISTVVSDTLKGMCTANTLQAGVEILNKNLSTLTIRPNLFICPVYSKVKAKMELD